jgi:putative membrane protein
MILAAVIHHLAFLGIFAIIVAQHLFVNRALTADVVRLLRRIDSVYLILAVLLLVVGFGRVFIFEKGWQYYKAVWPFHLKLTLYILLGLLSAYPSLRFAHWGRLVNSGQTTIEPSKKERVLVKMCLRLELLLIVGMVVCAVMMARGYSGNYSAVSSEPTSIQSPITPSGA